MAAIITSGKTTGRRERHEHHDRRDGSGRCDRDREADLPEMIHFNNSQTKQKQRTNNCDVEYTLLIGDTNKII